jgi:hypothetical protein
MPNSNQKGTRKTQENLKVQSQKSEWIYDLSPSGCWISRNIVDYMVHFNSTEPSVTIWLSWGQKFSVWQPRQHQEFNFITFNRFHFSSTKQRVDWKLKLKVFGHSPQFLLLIPLAPASPRPDVNNGSKWHLSLNKIYAWLKALCFKSKLFSQMKARIWIGIPEG